MTLFSPDWMMMSRLAGGWLLTYLIHSSLILAAAWALWKLLPEQALAAKELVWKTALLVGLLTASLQGAFAVEPLGGTWQLALGGDAPESLGAESAMTPDRRWAPATSPEGMALPPLATFSSEPVDFRGNAPWKVTRPELARWAAPAWLAGALVLLSLLAISQLRLRRRLADRTEVTEGRLRLLLDRLLRLTRTGAPVRLSASRRISVPMAQGVLQREICLPSRSLRELGEGQQEIVIAHELAHLERRDPLWLLMVRVLESLFFFQPLNRLAAVKLQEIAEYRCDDWAVEATGRPIGLAKCLTQVAGWRREDLARAPLAAMAGDPGRLTQRVARLLNREYPRPLLPVPRWLGPAMVGLFVATLLLAPAVVLSAVSADDELKPAPVESQAPAPAAAKPPAQTAAPAPLAPPAAVGPEARLPAPAAPPVAPLDEVGPAPSPPALLSVAATPAPAPVPAAPKAPGEPAPAPASPAFTRQEAEDLERTMEEVEQALEKALEPSLLELQVLIEEALQPALEARELLLEEELEGIEQEIEAAVAELVGEIEDRDLRDSIALPEEGLARIGELAGELARLAVPDPEQLERVGELAGRLAEQVRPDPEMLRQLTEQARKLATEAAPSPEELELLKQEARRLAEDLRPREEEMRTLAEQAREMAEQLRLTDDQRREIREQVGRLREELGVELEELRQLRLEQRESLREERRLEREGRERLLQEEAEPSDQSEGEAE